MRKIKFRGLNKQGKWVYGDLLQAPEQNQAWIVNQINNEVLPESVGEYTGLFDSTEWAQLTDKEKKEFWNTVCSEDGRSIKYETPDKAKHLWKGKELFEGDIVKCKDYIYVAAVVYRNGFFGLDTYRNETSNNPEYLYFFEDCKVIGNIYENPELINKLNLWGD